MTATLTLAQARRIALAAQGLHRPRPTGPATARSVGRTLARIQLAQIDSVNVLVRSHYLPFFSRLGPYDQAIVDRLASRNPRRMMEYWAHEASFIRPEHFHALRAWQKRAWVGAAGLDPAVRERLEALILEALAHGRPLTAAQLTRRLEHDSPRGEAWGWNWNPVKRVLEGLFEAGTVSSAARTPQFERRYALTSAVLPPGIPDGDAADPDEAILTLTEAAAQAHGIGTVRCFADYFRLPLRATAAAVSRLVAEGSLEEAGVDGWPDRLYLHAAAALPRTATGRALLSPFDSLVFERRRLERLFGFRYRIEIYTPAPRREYGYYVLPFLLRDRMAARVDLKADRLSGTLLVQAAHAEPGAPGDTAAELAAELQLLAGWLGLDGVRVADRGGLAPAVARAVGNRNLSAASYVSPVD
ncbi:winged helix-turn-helix domain-containing protein [Sinomonas mesophila]|uniref:winged helix-turn-helix domain-containing protein n=1 Tax=Sinomonas mesophila TaxID=1531955 RepID=UPI0009845894|nr:crosslink repair DNA glycosylase YcaQ family protein [Sinomonas mesophila]